MRYLLLQMAILSCSIACASQEKQQAVELRATSLWLAGRYVQQADYLGAAQLLDTIAPPNRDDKWYSLYALLYAEQGYHKQATEAFEQAIALNAANFAARINYATLLIRQMRYQVAQQVLRYAIIHAKGRQLAFAYHNYGISVFSETSDASGALNYFWKATQACRHCQQTQLQEFLRHYFTFAKEHQLATTQTARQFALHFADHQRDFEWLREYEWFTAEQRM